MNTHSEMKLARALEDLEHFEQGNGQRLDHGELSVPGRAGKNTDVQLDQYKALQARVKHWQAKVSAERLRAKAPERAAAKAAAYDALDLRTEHAGCTEIQTLTGTWLPVKRWNKKSVTTLSGTNYPAREIVGAR